jgi:hypothetical protein
MTSKININVNHSILIHKSCEVVWDFTQDFSLRTSWDPGILECRIVTDAPDRTADIRAKGGLSATLEYKLFDRPNKTSLRMTSIKSPLVVDGGGSWTYEKQQDNSTLWTQSNSITLKNSWMTGFLKHFIAASLKKNTVLSMQKAKTILEHQT